MTSLFISALRGENSHRPPVWLMRQAGRYLPQYQSYRKKYSLHEMFHNPELSAEVMISTVEVLGVDAAIMFSDILVITEALGCSIDFTKGGGPLVHPQVNTEEDISSLSRIPVEECLAYVRENIRLLKSSLSVPIIGFCGAPFTIAAYMLEERPSTDVEKLKKWIKEKPVALKRLLDRITEDTITYLKMQVEAGVDAIQVFDSWAHILSYDEFRQLAAPYLGKISRFLKETNIPLIIFCKNTSVFLPELISIAPKCISVDAETSLKQVKTLLPADISIQGNLDSQFLKLQSADEVRNRTLIMLEEMKGHKGYIANLGHGILPETPVKNVMTFIETIKSFTT